jgi:hypothetical protein
MRGSKLPRQFPDGRNASWQISKMLRLLPNSVSFHRTSLIAIVMRRRSAATL